MLQTLVASGASQCLSSYTGSRQIVSSAVRPQSLAIRKTLSQSGSHPTHTVVSQLASRRHLAGPISAAAVEESTAVEGEEPAEEVSEEEQLYFEDDDELVMYIKAEGFLTEASKGKVVKALEAVEGVSGVRVTVYEGCATAECTKITSVRATGVASAIVDILQTNGFTMQSLNLGFDDEAEAEPDFFSFTNTKFVDEDQPQQRSS